jgi:hypothetical protein
MGCTTIKPCGSRAGCVLSGLVLFQINEILAVHFVQGIYDYVPEKKHVSNIYIMFKVFCGYNIWYILLFYFYVSTFWSMCAVPNMAVFVLFSMLLSFFLNDCKVVPVASSITGITFVLLLLLLLLLLNMFH